jgi:hypothetical protein
MRFIANRACVGAVVMAAVSMRSAADVVGRSGQAGHDPRVQVEASLTAVGGRARLEAVRSIRLRGIYEENGIAWSPHADEPRPNFENFSELRDLAGMRVRRTGAFEAASRPRAIISVLLANVRDTLAARSIGGQWIVPARSLVEETAADLRLAPERLLLTAVAAADLHSAGDTSIDANLLHVVAFDHDRTRVYLDAVTALPFAVEVRHALPDDPAWNMWGDLTTRTVWTSWSLEPNGVRYPRTWTTFRNERMLKRTSIFELEFDVQAPADSFALPAELRSRVPPGLPRLESDSAVQLSDGVVLLRGGLNVLLVRQSDGVVIVETPYTPAYSRAVLREVNQRFPGSPVKAVVASDFMWPHFGGLREYVARGVPVYVPRGQEAVVRQFISRPHHIAPDSLAAAPVPLQLHVVEHTSMIGTGRNRLALIYAGVRGADYGNRMIVAYLPEHRLLYTGDLFPTAGEQNFIRQGAADVLRIVRSERLDPISVFGIHRLVTPWQPVADSVASLVAP